MHALIIEDEHLIAMAIEDVLRQCGFTSFEFAGSSQAAIEAASRRCPDLITSDVRLDPGCGIETVQSICGKTRIPVIFITGNGADVMRRLPTYQLLDKPFSDEALTAAVSKALTVTPTGRPG
jgi:DNA-binding response OmpR family regulator